MASPYAYAHPSQRMGTRRTLRTVNLAGNYNPNFNPNYTGPLPPAFAADQRRASAIDQFNAYKQQHLQHEIQEQELEEKLQNDNNNQQEGLQQDIGIHESERDMRRKMQIQWASWRLVFNRSARYVLRSLMVWPILSLLINFMIGTLLARVQVRPSGPYTTRTALGEYTVFFNGSASEAASIFIFVGGIIISITSVLFSLSIVAFQVAGVSYSPRLLEGLTRRKGTKIVLSVFLGTFAYCYSCLYTIKDTIGQGQYEDSGGAYYVPVFAVNFLIFYVVISLMALVYYLDFVVKSLAVSTLLDEVKQDLLNVVFRICSKVDPAETMNKLEEKADGDHNHADFDIDKMVKLPIVPANDAYVVYPSSSGYLLRVNEAFLVQIATSRRLNIRFRPKPGEYLTPTTPLGWVWRNRDIENESERHKYPRKFHPEELANMRAEINYCIELGSRRSIPPEDLAFGFKQMTDIALKALSPAINDPMTACETLDRCEQIFCEMAQRHLDHCIHKTEEGSIVALPRSSFSGLLEATVHPIRQYGAGDVCVARRMLYMLGAIGTSFSKEREFMRTRLRTVEHLIETVLVSCNQIHPDNSPEMNAVIFAAEHAYFLMHGGRNDRVHRYVSSDDEASESEADINSMIKVMGPLTVEQTQRQAEREEKELEPVVFEDIKEKEEDDASSDLDIDRSYRSNKEATSEPKVNVRKPDSTVNREEAAEPMNVQSEPLPQQALDMSQSEPDHLDTAAAATAPATATTAASAGLFAGEESTQAPRISEEPNPLQGGSGHNTYDMEASSSSSSDFDSTSSTDSGDDQVSRSKKNEKRLRKRKLMQKYKKWKKEHESLSSSDDEKRSGKSEKSHQS